MTASRRRLLLWVGVGVVVWNVYFDLWMTGAPREFLLRSALWELGRAPEPALAPLMRDAAREGALRATVWATAIVLAGLVIFRTRK